MGRNCTSPIRQTRLDQDNKIENYTVLSQANRQIIQVTVGESRQNSLNQGNPLMQQEVQHSFYTGEKNSLKPLAKYAYDPFGTIVNQHRV